MNTTKEKLTFLENVRIRDKNRISLGKLVEELGKVIHGMPSSFDVYLDSQTGNLVFKPKMEIPAAEAWLFNNPKALAAVQAGLREAHEKKFVPSPMREDDSWAENLDEDE